MSKTHPTFISEINSLDELAQPDAARPTYNREYGDERQCICGHPYYRHFDTYDQMWPVGCKYCDCDTFAPQPDAAPDELAQARMTPKERAIKATNHIRHLRVSYEEVELTIEQAIIDAMSELEAQLARWKTAVEGLTPSGSEFVNEPENCAAHIRQRLNYPRQIVELRAQLASARNAKRITEDLQLATAAELDEVKAQLASLTHAAHMPDDYPYGLPSWINQRLYRAYIEQGKDQPHWDALTAALDARDKAEAQLAEAQRERNLPVSVMAVIRENERLRGALEAAESQIAGWKMCPKCGRVVALIYPNHSPNPGDMGICRLSLTPVGVMPVAQAALNPRGEEGEK